MDLIQTTSPGAELAVMPIIGKVAWSSGARGAARGVVERGARCSPWRGRAGRAVQPVAWSSGARSAHVSNSPAPAMRAEKRSYKIFTYLCGHYGLHAPGLAARFLLSTQTTEKPK